MWNPPGTVSARNPKVIRASAGTFFRMPVAEQVGPATLIRYADEKGLPLFRTSATEGLDFFDADFAGGCVIVLGNEAQGVTSGAWPALPAVRIPMARGVDSLNVAAAGAILLFEAARRRRAHEPGLTNRSPKA